MFHHLPALSFVVDLGTGGLPEQVRMFLDVEGQSGPWAEHKAELAWMRLADSAPPKTLDEARERLDELRKPAWAVIRKNKAGKWWNIERFEEGEDGAVA